MARKTEFELNRGAGLQQATAKIIKEKKSRPHVIIRFVDNTGKVRFADLENDLERFAVNILKALNSKILKK